MNGEIVSINNHDAKPTYIGMVHQHFAGSQFYRTGEYHPRAEDENGLVDDE